jgi:hypothetical protein
MGIGVYIASMMYIEVTGASTLCHGQKFLYIASTIFMDTHVYTATIIGMKQHPPLLQAIL